MKKLWLTFVWLILFVFTGCGKETVYYNASELKSAAFIDLEDREKYAIKLNYAMENYGLNFEENDIVIIADNMSKPCLLIPKDSSIRIILKKEKEYEYNRPVIVGNIDGYTIFIKEKWQDRQEVSFDNAPESKLEKLTDKVMLNHRWITDKDLFKERLHGMGYTDEMLEKLDTYYYTSPDDKRLFLLSYGRERMTDNEGETTEILSPAKNYTIRETAVSWGGEGVNNALFVDNNSTFETQIVNEKYWNNSRSCSPQFINENSFVCYNGERVGLFTVEDTVNPVLLFENPDKENMSITKAYYNKRDDNIIIAYCKNNNLRDTYEESEDYYKFAIVSKEGRLIKELNSTLKTAWTVGGIATPEFLEFTELHPQGKLYLRLWKYGMFAIDLHTGKAEEFIW